MFPPHFFFEYTFSLLNLFSTESLKIYFVSYVLWLCLDMVVHQSNNLSMDCFSPMTLHFSPATKDSLCPILRLCYPGSTGLRLYFIIIIRFFFYQYSWVSFHVKHFNFYYQFQQITYRTVPQSHLVHAISWPSW